MSQEIYSAPAAELEQTAEAADNLFYVVSPLKFWLMFSMTFGLYRVYWFYRNWHNVQAATGEKMIPVMRGLFSIFFAHILFREVDKELQERNIAVQWSPDILATLYVIAAITANVCGRLFRMNIGVPFTGVLSILLIPIIAYALYQAQCRINLAMGDPKGESNSHFSAGNIIWMVLGILLWVLMAAGIVVAIFYPELAHK